MRGFTAFYNGNAASFPNLGLVGRLILKVNFIIKQIKRKDLTKWRNVLIL